MKTVFSIQRYPLAFGHLISSCYPCCPRRLSTYITPKINARTYILMDYKSGKVLAEVNADILSNYVIGHTMKAGRIHPMDKVTIGKDACATPAIRFCAARR